MNIRRTVHPLPMAILDQGREEDVYIGEGQKADVQIQLIGTPPCMHRANSSLDNYWRH